MSLSNTTLAAIQKLGAAAFNADERLKKEVKIYADRVNAAVMGNPYNLGNDTLIDNWKVVARLSQTLASIEGELQKVFQVASELSEHDQPSVHDVPALPAPSRSTGKAKKVAVAASKQKTTGLKKASTPVASNLFSPKGSTKKAVTSQADLAPTDVMAKPKMKAAEPKAKVSKVKRTLPSGKAPVLSANPAKLLAYFERALNSNEFSAVSQKAAAQETGIPMGSMSAAIKKLVETGRITAAADGGLKLAISLPPLNA